MGRDLPPEQTTSDRLKAAATADHNAL